MRTSLFTYATVVSAMLMFGLTLSAVRCFPQSATKQTAPSSAREKSLREFLQKLIRTKNFPGQDDTRYAKAFVDLNSDGKEEAIVIMVGRWMCGSGGCTSLILTPQETSWRVVSTLLGTDTPIRVLTTRSNGWHNISFSARNPGEPAYEAELQFDGNTYPVSPQTPVSKNAPGKVLIPSLDVAIPLF